MPAVQVDLIYCQNLLVYFRRWLREKILNAFVQRLKPGGALVIGLGEVLDWSHPSMQRALRRRTGLYTQIKNGTPSMGEQRNYAALDWVVGEIGETLKRGAPGP